MERTERELAELSVVVPVLRQGTDPAEIYRLLSPELSLLEEGWEFVFVADGLDPAGLAGLERLAERHPRRVLAVVLPKSRGEAAALTAGFTKARGRTVLTLGSHLQVEPAALGMVLEALRTGGADMVVGRRYPRRDGLLARLQSKAYHWLVRLLTDTSFRDMSCGLRAMKPEVARDLDLYGDFHRFIPVLVESRGFVVHEVAVPQSPADRPSGLYGPASYARRFLDLMSLFFLVRFTQRPLRFFGMVGMMLFAAGGLITLYLGLYRLLRLGGIADRPLLLLGLLLLVMGAQSLSIGLLGELIIFTRSRARAPYRVAEIIEGSSEDTGAERGGEATEATGESATHRSSA